MHKEIVTAKDSRTFFETFFFLPRFKLSQKKNLANIKNEHVLKRGAFTAIDLSPFQCRVVPCHGGCQQIGRKKRQSVTVYGHMHFYDILTRIREFGNLHAV